MGAQEMPPIIKDSDTLAATQETTSSAVPNDSAVKPQPVALEVPITVNGARTIEGGDKREPFSETTKTVMVHGSGAVIRLNSAMAPGQLLFLTNERTKKEVVCQVVKSKNYRNISGYVELEFTEPAVGFWGMRFPGDRLSAIPQAAPARLVTQKTELPAAPSAPSTVATKPSVAIPVASKPVSTAAPGSSGAPASLHSATLSGMPKSKPSVGVTPTVATSLGSEERLVEPWLKKREPAARVPAVPPRVAASEPPTKNEHPGPTLPAARDFGSTSSSDKPASLFAPTEAPSNPVNVDLSGLTPFFEVKPGAIDTPQPAAPVKALETEDLKEHTARLQEELSKMQFEPVASSPVKVERVKAEVEIPAFPLTEQAISAIKTELVHESAVELIEKSEPPTEAPVLPEPVLEALKETPPAPIPALETLQHEEMKIPAWLEPLARNASAPSSTQELVHREKAKRKAEQPQLVEVTAPVVARAEKSAVSESRIPQFGSALPFEEPKRIRESSPRKSGNGMLVAALAAGVVLLAGGGWWYMNQRSAGAHASASASEAPAVSTGSQDSKTNSQKEAAMGTMLPAHENEVASPSKPAAANSNVPINEGKNLRSSASASSTTVAARNPQVASSSLKAESAAGNAASPSPEVVPHEVKKPALGDVHLAAPKISQKRPVQAAAEPDAAVSLSEDQPEANAGSLGAGIGIANNQPAAPAAPVAVGGDVRQAKLISSVPPEYPALAKAQHVSGSVTIDALIDATGRVTKMNVVSGPTLLHQAAMDSLKQWKYQPAMLDGKPVPMHLSVTIQFRLQ